jgi:hypothetical protein
MPGGPAGGQVQMFLYATPGLAHVVESSSNLTNWTELLTVTPTNSPTRITDPAGVSQRFYRARLSR